MKKLIFFLFFLPMLSFAGTVENLADQTLKELQALSTSWRSVKDMKTAEKSATFSKAQSKKLVAIANELKLLKRPSNEERLAIHNRRKKAIEKVGDEMIHTMGLLRRNASAMAVLAKALEDIDPEMQRCQKVFNHYFEPDTIPKQ